MLDVEQLRILLPEAQQCLRKATETFKTTVKALKEGSVTLQELNIVTEEKTMKQFLETYEAYTFQEQRNAMSVEQLQKIMEWRRRELGEWKKEKKLTIDLLKILKDQKLSEGINI